MVCGYSLSGEVYNHRARGVPTMPCWLGGGTTAYCITDASITDLNSLCRLLNQ